MESVKGEVIKEVLGYMLLVSSFLFIWIGWRYEELRVPLLLTYIAMWFWSLIVAYAIEKKKEE